MTTLALFDVEAPAAVELHIGACTGGHPVRYTAAQVASFRARLAYVPCRAIGCQRPAAVRPVIGTHAPGTRCNATCQNATGPACSCSCAGRNHGGRWSL